VAAVAVALAAAAAAVAVALACGAYNGGMETYAIRTENLGRTYKLPRRRWPPAPAQRSAPPEPTANGQPATATAANGQPHGQPPGQPAAATAANVLTALRDVNLEVRTGELFGLLGPNGAGKTTLIKILTTLLAPTEGKAWVNGLDVVTQARQIRPQINMVSGGESSGYGVLTVRENLWLFAQMYGVPTALAHERIDRMLEVVGLSDRARTKVSHLSTGLRQKMNFCRGFITDPCILFLDEPTLGLDVTSARAIRRFVRQWLKESPQRTLLLTTHYMMEADELCDRIAIIDSGQVLKCDTPAGLKRQAQRHPIYTLSITPGHTPGQERWRRLAGQPGIEQLTLWEQPTHIDLRAALTEDSAIGVLVQAVVDSGSRILNLHKAEPTLEDVFIELVGRGLESTPGTATAAERTEPVGR
jgi:ABC-2 type transport system ATP-binding protein